MKKLGIWSCVLLILVFSIVPVAALAAQAQVVTIPVRVQAEGSEADRQAEYTVELIPRTTGCPMPEDCDGSIYRLTLKGGETGSIRIPCDTLGVYKYTIRQVPGTDPDCTYDEREYTLQLFVTAQEDGTVSASAQISLQEGEKEPQVLFHNHWADPVYLSFSARKTLDGNTPEDGAFTFRLLSEDGEVVYEVKNDGRRVTFPELRFDREGTYRFFLKEVARQGTKILYDRSVYTITVTVTKDVDYQAQVTYERNGKPWYGTPSFANYTDTGSPKTGDGIGIWFSALGLSAAALAALLVLRRRKQ